MRAANIYYKDVLSGTLTENENGFTFQYINAYLTQKESKPVSLTLPLSETPYNSKVLFPFFDGLIPEGWLLDIALTNWKVDAKDRFGLLLLLCRNCIGCVSVLPTDTI